MVSGVKAEGRQREGTPSGSNHPSSLGMMLIASRVTLNEKQGNPKIVQPWQVVISRAQVLSLGISNSGSTDFCGFLSLCSSPLGNAPFYL